MPVYEYECSHCRYYLEVIQKIGDARLIKCPSCGRNALKKLISAPVFRLKGSGWYETDFKSDQESKRNLAGEKEPAASEPAPEKSSAESEAKGAGDAAPSEAKADKGAAAAKSEAPERASASAAKSPAPSSKAARAQKAASKTKPASRRAAPTRASVTRGSGKSRSRGAKGRRGR
jgi:putative FmdB family regulatory protein